MVASLLRLRALGLANRLVLPRSRAEQVTSLLGLLAAIGVVVGIVLLAEFGVATTAELRHVAFVAVGSVVVAAFWLVPLVVRTSGGLEPRAFTSLPIPPTRLALGLAVSALASIPVLLLVGLLAAYVISWAAAGPGAALLALVSGLLVIAIAVLGSLISATLASDRLMLRNTTGTILVALVAIIAPLIALVDWAALGFTVLRRVADALHWTPLGIAWAIPGDVALGRPGTAWLHAAAAVVLIGVLWLVWLVLVRVGIRQRAKAVDARTAVRLGAFDVLPDSQAGVVAARSVTYWLRDPRYIVPLLILPLIPVGITVALWLAGIDWSVIIWLPIPLVSLLIGWSVHNDVAADGTAFWLHVVTSVRGRADRWGRLLVPLAIGLPVAIAGSVASAVLVADERIALPLVSLSVCALLAGLGVGSVASAIAPYPTVQPGDSPFQQPQGGGGSAPRQLVSILLAVAACSPVVLAVLAAFAAGSHEFSTATALGFVIGPVVLIAGVELGALAMQRRAPELLAFTQRN